MTTSSSYTTEQAFNTRNLTLWGYTLSTPRWFNIILNTAKQLKYHYFAVEQQPHLSLPEKASQVSRTAFLSFLVQIYGAQLTKGSVLFICDPLTTIHISLIYDTLFHPLSDTLFEFLNGIWSEIQPSDREGLFRKSSFEFLKGLAPALNTNNLHSRKKRTQNQSTGNRGLQSTSQNLYKLCHRCRFERRRDSSFSYTSILVSTQILEKSG